MLGQLQVAGEEAAIFWLHERQDRLAGPGIRAGEKPDPTEVERRTDDPRPIELDAHRPKASLWCLGTPYRSAQGLSDLPADFLERQAGGLLFDLHAGWRVG